MCYLAFITGPLLPSHLGIHCNHYCDVILFPKCFHFMTSSCVNSKRYKGPEGDGNYTFHKILTKSKGLNYANFLETWKKRRVGTGVGCVGCGGGGGDTTWRSVCNNLHTESSLPGRIPLPEKTVFISQRGPTGSCPNSSRPSDAYMHQWTRSHLFQIMAIRLFGTKPLFEPMLPQCHLKMNFSDIGIKIHPFSHKKIDLKMPSAIGSHFASASIY